MVFSFRRLNHNLDFSFLHIKNPVGDFSPTGFVEQPHKVVWVIYPNSFIFSEKSIKTQIKHLFYADESGKIKLENKRGF